MLEVHKNVETIELFVVNFDNLTFISHMKNIYNRYKLEVTSQWLMKF